MGGALVSVGRARGFGRGLETLSGIGTASGGTTSGFAGSVTVTPLDSLARMFSVWFAGRGSGTLLINSTPVAPPPPAPPQFSACMAPRIAAYIRMPPNRKVCSATDHASGCCQDSCSFQMSAFRGILVQWLRDQGNLGEAGALGFVHHGGEDAVGHFLVATHVDGLVFGIADLLVQAGAEFMAVAGLVAGEG